MAVTQKHRDYTNWIINQANRLNPHPMGSPESRIWVVGFLASYLANTLSEDLFARREYERHIDRLVKQRQRPD